MDTLGLNVDASRSNAPCSSIEDLQGQLHHLLAAKPTETRAEHVAPNFEILPHAIFHLPPDGEDAATDGPGSHPADPVQPQPQPEPLAGGRTVAVSETVQNQPADDPVLQRAVAKHITTAIGAVDGSAWTVRQVTRGAQGWQFTYICKHSLQAWNRANAKNPARPVIASYSGYGGLDPINLSRPAFDCRGTLTISFSKSSRNIAVKYEHTPLHKTVAQLVERLVPAPIPVPVPIVQNASQRTPKPKRTKPVGGEDGQDTSHKKRTPKTKRPPPIEGEEGSKKKKRRKTTTAPVANTNESEGGQNTPQSQVQPISSATEKPLTGFLNVPPAEAERRRQTATNLLIGKNIDPATLSAEQFNIFANQAPNLQSASLEMLAKYGAERLRIVHPDEKESSGSSNSTPAPGQNENDHTQPSQASGQPDEPSKKPRSKAKKTNGASTEVSIGNGAVVPVEQGGELGTTESALTPKVKRFRKTRGRCDTCRIREVTCTKEHPSCSTCLDAGVDCVYLPPKPRRKSEKQAEVFEQEETEIPEENQSGSAQHTEENAGQASMPDSPASHAAVLSGQPPDIENEEFIPDPNILAEPAVHHAVPVQTINIDNYYQHPHREASFPQASAAPTVTGSHSMPNFTYPQGQHNGETSQATSAVAFPPLTMHPQPSPNDVHSSHGSPLLLGLPAAQPASSSASHRRTRPTSSSSRKSLPTGQIKQTPVPPPAIPVQAANWSSQPMQPATSTSPPVTHQQAPKRAKSRKPVQQGQDHSGQGSQPTQYQSPMTRSPFQSAAQVNPRQGHRSQNTTPVATNPRPPPQAPSATATTTTHPPATSAPSYHTPTASNSLPHYDPYPRYNNTSSGNEQHTSTENTHSSRNSYEPSSYQVHATTTAPSSYSSIPSYDYGRTSGTSNPLSQALNGNAAYSGTASAMTSQWPTSQTRGAQNTNSSSTYALPTNSTSASHGYGTRGQDSRTTSQTPSYNQPQSQSYSSYPQQQTNMDQQGQQNWYRYPTGNSGSQTGYASNRQSSHASHRANAPAYSNQYGGNDEQALYDMLRTGQPNH